jgi:hypothetical protein
MTNDLGQMYSEARKYVRELQEGGRRESIRLFSYRTRANNYPDTDRRSLESYAGYAVQFSTTEAEDRRINESLRVRGVNPKFHNRSLVLFVNGDGIPMDKLWPHGRIIADFAHEEVTPMWLGWRSPFEDSDKFNPDRETCGFKRATPHDDYTEGDGPIATWHLLLDEVSDR